METAIENLKLVAAFLRRKGLTEEEVMAVTLAFYDAAAKGLPWPEISDIMMGQQS